MYCQPRAPSVCPPVINSMGVRGGPGPQGATGPDGTGLFTTSVFLGDGAGKSDITNNFVAIGFEAGIEQGLGSIAIGNEAGKTNQGLGSVAVGSGSGTTTQGINSVAVGHDSGSITQGTESVAIGDSAGVNSLASGSVAVGYRAGFAGTGADSVSIGSNTGSAFCGINTICIGTNMDAGNVVSGTGSILISSQGSNLYGSTAFPSASCCVINWDRTPGPVPGLTSLVTRPGGRMYLGVLPQQPGGAATTPVIPADCPAGWAVVLYDNNSGEVAIGAPSA